MHHRNQKMGRCACCFDHVEVPKPTYDIPKPKNVLVEIVSTAKVDMKNFIEWAGGTSNVCVQWQRSFDDGSTTKYCKPLRFFKPSLSETPVEFLNRVVHFVHEKANTNRTNVFMVHCCHGTDEIDEVGVLEHFHGGMISSLIAHQLADDVCDNKDVDDHVKAVLSTLSMAKDPIQQKAVDQYTVENIKFRYYDFLKSYLPKVYETLRK